MSAHEPIGHGLNPAQKEAVLYLDGPCLVLAGAGSGKTRVITQKIAYLLRECGYMGRNVVALTFTNKAAREMDERVKTLVDRKLGKGLTISTFHSLGVKLLREEARNAGLKPTFSILDADDAMAIIQRNLLELYNSMLSQAGAPITGTSGVLFAHAAGLAAGGAG